MPDMSNLLRRSTTVFATLAVTSLLALTACSSEDSSDTVTLITHDSFKISDDVVKKFEKQSGLTLRILRNGDAGEAVNKALLSKEKPQGDVFFGIDNTLLSRALDEEVFEPYTAKNLDKTPKSLQLDKEHRVTPIDYGDVCVNADRSAYESGAWPNTLDELTEPAQKNSLVVEDPSTSSPGLAFLLATVAKYGEEGYRDYWKELKDNGVLVASGWEEAYYEKFSGAAGSDGTRSLVVSYASSPVAEVHYAEDKPDVAPTAVATDTCFRQVEFAGVLKNAKRTENAQKLVDFLLSETFQKDIPLNMFVYPAREKTPLPAVFKEHTTVVENPHTLTPKEIAAGREKWIAEWRNVVLS